MVIVSDAARLAGAASVLALVLGQAPVLAQESPLALPGVVVSASRIAVPAEQVGSSVTVITAEELAERQTVLVADILRDVPGVAVSRSGGVGTPTQVRIRGAEANQTVVIIDGVEAGDPVSGEFDFGSLLAGDIERIEVLRGPQSALWGADAIGGVVNIVTRKGTKGWQAHLSGETGSFATVLGNARIAGGNDRVDGALAVSGLTTEGFNIAREGGEKDGAGNLTLQGNLRYRPLDNLELALTGRHADTRTDTDPQDFAFPPTPTNGLVIDGDEQTRTSQFTGRAQATLDLMEGAWRHTLGANLTEIDYRYYIDGQRTGGNDGRRTRFDYQSSYRFETPGFAAATHDLILLAEHARETFENMGATPDAPENQKRHRDQTGLVGEYRLGLWQQLFLSGAVRQDWNSGFDDATTWRLTAAYLVPAVGTRLHGSYGTGVTNPTFYEQFGFFPESFVGNPDLKPEKSEGFDVGIEQPFFDGRLVADLTFFHTDLEDEIVTAFDPATFLSTVVNQDGRSRRQGVELALTAEPWAGGSLHAAYTYTDAEDPDGGQEVRRPRHVASLQASQRFLDGRAQLGIGIQYNGRQTDSEFVSTTPGTTVELDSYTLVDLFGAYALTDRVELYGRVENLFDESYEEVFSYSAPGIAFYAGMRVSLGGGAT
ncbi:MAG TPA: TonB-dependent receptor [Geminicoccus sp.]|uniref:TonB-dependent receptor plug domain-containing protein n=1 Tax=Geminicoccus sp. TaxID=2024832 RepID=UPI002CD55F64|nr:TonB-dependent receptor [Geminicoccus sp.]HWL70015.1 TonB-dependent receptor [Geminicoccus sp.]